MPSRENKEAPGAGRLTAFKNQGKGLDEMRRRRQEVTVELRKARKDDQLSKRRNIADSLSPLSPSENANVPTLSVEEIIAGMNSASEDVKLSAVQAARKTLSREKNPPISSMIAAGIVPKCVEFLNHGHNPSLQFESAWALTNIASGTSDQTHTVIAAGAVPRLVELLGSSYMHVAEQAVWAIGNIAGDGPSARDLVLNHGAMGPLLDLVKPDTSVHVLRNVVWCISNLCRHKTPAAPFELVKIALPTLCRLLHSTDKDVLSDACWAISYLTDGDNDKIQAVVDTGIVTRLVLLLGYPEHTVLTPALRAVGNVVTGNDVQTDSVLLAGGLALLRTLLTHERLNIVKEAAWTISNILAGNVDQIQAVLDAGILPPLISVLAKGDFKAQKEAAWAVTNYTSGASVDQLTALVQEGAMGPFCAMLDASDWKTIQVVLDGLNNMLQAAEKMGQVECIALVIEECGGLDKLEALQQHDNETVYQKALSMIDRYFSDQENEPPAVAAPSEENGEFRFNSDNADENGPQGGFNF